MQSHVFSQLTKKEKKILADFTCVVIQALSPPERTALFATLVAGKILQLPAFREVMSKMSDKKKRPRGRGQKKEIAGCHGCLRTNIILSTLVPTR